MNPSPQIILGIGGSIAAYKSLELIRLLQKQGMQVQAMPTKSALDFVTLLSLNTLTGTPLRGPLPPIVHIESAYNADALLIAPATANLIARMAHGFADELLLQTYLSFKGPVLLAPAMETNMWEHPATQSNIQILKERGCIIISPESGDLASGREGIGRLVELETIIEHVHFTLAPKDFAGKRVLLTAGPTVEELDPVRYLSNYSSGKMGIALARALAHRGAEVELVHGPLQVPVPKLPNIHAHPVQSAQDMLALSLEYGAKSDIGICCAAVCDFRPENRESRKIKKLPSPQGGEGPGVRFLELAENPDILKTLASKPNKPFLVGFAAETDFSEQAIIKKCQRKNCDLICANHVNQDQSPFGNNSNQITIANQQGILKQTERLSKDEIANQILDAILTLCDSPSPLGGEGAGG
ncbi:MAG: bifunctional phosphopantothenoylcysteine decarboxylase/phosphopantothenate--cysteine ligase CoaBC [Deltaproteobacteria bacterium]|nr:bifunctional phosphopantothenoylcysteine decarboxylase/phosphopantothenate--cysteine ligase CoaBC [Deltaproteobacteria bacterium]